MGRCDAGDRASRAGCYWTAAFGQEGGQGGCCQGELGRVYVWDVTNGADNGDDAPTQSSL